MANLFVEESYINATKGYRFGDSDVYETAYDSPGDLYRAMQREYGRCTSKVYMDGPDGGAVPVGWVFVGRSKYDDSPETYLREVWVTVHREPPTHTVKRHLLNLETGKEI